jgi:hypothetical protein
VKPEERRNVTEPGRLASYDKPAERCRTPDAHQKCEQFARLRSMRLRVSDPAILPDVLAFLERHGAVVTQVSDREIDAGLVGSYGSEERMRLDLFLLIRAWEAGRAERAGAVEIVT